MTTEIDALVSVRWLGECTFLTLIIAFFCAIIWPEWWPAWLIMSASQVGHYLDGKRVGRKAH